jgi:hypothetical protein
LPERMDVAVRRPVGVRDIPLVVTAPRRLFARVEDVAVWGWPLLVLLTAVTLVGYAVVQTGLIDRQIDVAVRESIAQIESTQRDVVERSALRDLYDQEYKKGEFEKLLTRMKVVVAEPASALATVLLVATALYGIVALTGRKPEWHTLLTLCVFAGFIDLLRLLVALGLMLRYRSLEVDTSLALLAQLVAAERHLSPLTAAAWTGLLSGLDPFKIWFWAVLMIGLSATSQLRGWRVWLACGLCWLAAAGARCGLAAAMTLAATDGAPAGG